MSQLNGSLSVGIRNLFGCGEKLDLSADLGLATSNQSSLSSLSSSSSSNDNLFDENIIHNTSNQYNIKFNKPSINLSPYITNSNLIIRGFQQKLDRTRSSSYRQDLLGTTTSLISSNKQHCLSYNYHLRSLIPTYSLGETQNDDDKNNE